jgi:putative ABC transport system permease protein
MMNINDGDSSEMTEQDGLVRVPPALLLLSTTPLLGVALLSHRMGLGLESPIVVGIIRTLVQLTILGSVLRPIFAWGERLWWVVLVYLLFMIVLASWEASTRNSKYYFAGMVECVFAALLVNVGVVSIFAFGVIIRPSPMYNPHYVIPIVGMLLGNCISGVSLSLNNMLNGIQEQGSEIEVFLAFGANSVEASSRVVREAVRVGAMPMLNSMAVIGIISIPGMMTGQILGGSPPMTAAVYQMLILILIATCTFGTILAEVAIVRSVAFENEMLHTRRFRLRPGRQNFLETIAWMATVIRRQKQAMSGKRSSVIPIAETAAQSEATPLTHASMVTGAGDGRRSGVEVSTIRYGSRLSDLEASRKDANPPLLEVRCISRTVGGAILGSSPLSGQHEKQLFHRLSFVLYPGDIVAVRGPSGAGKSQLLRAVAGLSPLSTDDALGESKGLFLDGAALAGSSSVHLHDCSPTQWRRQIRYVTQTRIELPGTPRDFLHGVSTFSSWIPNEWARRISNLGSEIRSSLRRMSSASNVGAENLNLAAHPSPTRDEMTVICTRLIEEWGLMSSHLDKPWKLLSGGESQRIFVAITIASAPRVLLLDESTSALDLTAKLRVEKSILEVAASTGMAVMWITHDDDQIRRLQLNPS